MLSRLMLLMEHILPKHKYLVEQIELLARVTVTATHLKVIDHVTTTVLEAVELGPKEAVDRLRKSPLGFQIDAPDGLARRFKQLYLDLVFESLNTSEYSEHVKVMLYYDKAGKNPYISGIAHLAV